MPVDWIHFGPSTSGQHLHLAHAFDGWLRPGDAIIVTNQDHEANTGVWRKLAGARRRDPRMDSIDKDTGHLPIDGLDKLLDSKVRARLRCRTSPTSSARSTRSKK